MYLTLGHFGFFLIVVEVLGWGGLLFVGTWTLRVRKYSRDPFMPHTVYLEGQGDFVSGSIRGITRITIWGIGVINLLTKSP